MILFSTFKDATTNNRALNMTFKTHATICLNTYPLEKNQQILEGCVV